MWFWESYQLRFEGKNYGNKQLYLLNMNKSLDIHWQIAPKPMKEPSVLVTSNESTTSSSKYDYLKSKKFFFFLISFFPNVDIKCVPYRFAVSQKFIVEREEPYYFNIWIKVILQCLKKKSYLKKYLLPKLTDLLNMPRIFYAK